MPAVDAALPVVLEHPPPRHALAWPHHAGTPVGTMPVAPRAARAFVSERLRGWGREDAAERAALIVSELVTNAVQASWPLYASLPVRVCVAEGEGHALLQVWDLSPEMPQPRPRAEGGRGLVIVAELSQSWGVYPDEFGKWVWAYF